MNEIPQKIKLNEIKQKFKCEVFEVYSNETINKPFYYFFQSSNTEIIKSGIEYNNPFLNLDKKNINIGLFGDK